MVPNFSSLFARLIRTRDPTVSFEHYSIIRLDEVKYGNVNVQCATVAHAVSKLVAWTVINLTRCGDDKRQILFF